MRFEIELPDELLAEVPEVAADDRSLTGMVMAQIGRQLPTVLQVELPAGLAQHLAGVEMWLPGEPLLAIHATALECLSIAARRHLPPKE